MFRAIPTNTNASCRRKLQVRASAAAAAANGGGDGKVMMRKEAASGAWKIDYSGEKPATPLLDTVNYPVHMKNLSTPELEQLAAELRGERVAVLEGRKQYCWYLKGIAHSGYYKEQIVRMNTLEDARAVTKGIQRDLTD